MGQNTFDIGSVGTAAATTAATDLVSGIFGLATEKHNDKRQLRQQGALQNLQIAGNKEMIDYQKMKDLEMWKATGPTGMMAELSKAGLNPGLVYGMSGAGGQSTGGSGSVTGADAPKGGREIMDAAQMGMQMQLLQAQKENIQADTENKKADTANKPLQGENIKADTALKEIGWDIAAIEKDIKGRSSNMTVATIETSLRKLTAEMNKAETEQKITAETADATIQQAKTQLAQMVAVTKLTEAQEKLTGTQDEKLKQEIEKIKSEIQKLNDPESIQNYFEREKIRIAEKGINVAIISATLGAILRFTGN